MSIKKSNYDQGVHSNVVSVRAPSRLDEWKTTGPARKIIRGVGTQLSPVTNHHNGTSSTSDQGCLGLPAINDVNCKHAHSLSSDKNIDKPLAMTSCTDDRTEWRLGSPQRRTGVGNPLLLMTLATMPRMRHKRLRITRRCH